MVDEQRVTFNHKTRNHLSNGSCSTPAAFGNSGLVAIILELREQSTCFTRCHSKNSYSYDISLRQGLLARGQPVEIDVTIGTIAV